MLEQYTENEKKGFIKALVIGLVLGFIANYSAHAFVRESDTPLLSFKEKIKYGIVRERIQRCAIVGEQVQLLTEPSNLTGTAVRPLNKGLQVDYLEPASSLDTDANKAIAAYDLQFTPLFHRTVYIPKGTPFTIEAVTGNEYKCSFVVNGKAYNKRFEKQLLTRAYTGEWYKVKIGENIGYIKSIDAGRPQYM